MMEPTAPPDHDEHDDSESPNDEAVGLITERSPRDMASLELEIMSELADDDERSEYYRLRRWSVVVLLTLVATVMTALVHARRRAGLALHPPSPPVRYQCPKSPVAKSKNDKFDNFDEYIEQDAKWSKPSTFADETFRQSGYDGFTSPYEEAKANVAGWKGRNFAPALRSGGSIYESACGTAMNLLMTIELLAEMNVTGLRVYGSEYVPESVAVARSVLSQHSPGGTRIGSICPGDSTDLFFVPSASFDLVFTGYIDPLIDPLGLIGNATANFTTDDCGSEQSLRFCKSDDPDEHALAEREQGAQEDWFASWVSEMVRIAKPGGTVAVEEVAKPMCDILKDWGGVSKDWWKEAVRKYGWDVDVESIRFEDAVRNPRYHGRRYNVAMRKKMSS